MLSLRAFVRQSDRFMCCPKIQSTRQLSGISSEKQDWFYGHHGFDQTQIDFFVRAKQFAVNKFRPNALQWDADSHFPRDVLLDAGREGFGGMVAAKEFGGQQLSRKHISAIVEGLASECVSTTAYITIHNGVLAMIDKFASRELRARYVPGLCRMELLASFCLTEPGSGSDAASISTTGVLDTSTDEYVITGNKCFISGAGSSDILLVMFRSSPEALSCAIVPRDTAGVTFGANEKKMGWKTQPTRQVHFDQVRVPRTNLVGKEGQGFKIAMVGLDGARLSIAACSLGAGADALQRTVAFVRERNMQHEQYVQFKLAEMFEKLSAGRLLLRQAAEMVDSGSSGAPQYCAFAKQVCTDHSAAICGDAIQLMAIDGLLQKQMVEKHWRDVRVHQILEGTNEIMRHIIGRSLVS